MPDAILPEALLSSGAGQGEEQPPLFVDHLQCGAVVQGDGRYSMYSAHHPRQIGLAQWFGIVVWTEQHRQISQPGDLDELVAAAGKLPGVGVAAAAPADAAGTDFAQNSAASVCLVQQAVTAPAPEQGHQAQGISAAHIDKVGSFDFLAKCIRVPKVCFEEVIGMGTPQPVVKNSAHRFVVAVRV